METPFDVAKQHQSITEPMAKEYFQEGTTFALKTLETDFEKIVQSERAESDLLIYFDCLMQDFIQNKYKIEAD